MLSQRSNSAPKQIPEHQIWQQSELRQPSEREEVSGLKIRNTKHFINNIYTLSWLEKNSNRGGRKKVKWMEKWQLCLSCFRNMVSGLMTNKSSEVLAKLASCMTERLLLVWYKLLLCVLSGMNSMNNFDEPITVFCICRTLIRCYLWVTSGGVLYANSH